MLKDVQFIRDPQALQQLIHSLQDSSWLCLDTEFIREKTFYPQLCLIQVADDKHIACIDPLAIDRADLEPFYQFLQDPKRLKIFHAGFQDLEIFYFLTGKVLTPIFDTQITAAILGDGEQIGYGRLVQQRLGISLDKSLARTDWSLRPLSEDQVRYASDDVRYLRELYQVHQQELQQLERESWPQRDFDNLGDEQRFQGIPEQLWKKVKGNQQLKGNQLAVLRALAAWRDRQARELNRPRKWIISDDALTEIAQRPPSNEAQLMRIRSVNPQQIKRWTDDILSEIEQAKQRPKDDWPKHPKWQKNTPEQEAVIDALHAVLRLQAQTHNISPAALASRKDLENFYRQPDNHPLSSGWKGTVAGDALNAFLQGDLRLQMHGLKLNMRYDGS